jgi:hypothetical protein
LHGVAQVHARRVSLAQQQRFVFAPRKVDGKFFVNLALNPVDGLAEIVDALDGIAGKQKRKAQQLAVEVPVVLQAKALSLGS